MRTGLSSIFGSDVSKMLDDIQNNELDVAGRKRLDLNISEIRPNPYQPRKEFDEQALKELSESIKTHGVFTPILVRQSIKGYELIAGERRLRAAKRAGLNIIPAICVDFTDEDMMEVAILENVQREDLNPIEEAAAYESLMDKLNYTQEKLAERVGKSREYCANMLRLLKLPKPVQDMVRSKKLTAGHVRPLITLSDDDLIIEVANKVRKDHMSVRATEQYIKNLSGNTSRQSRKNEQEKDPGIAAIENTMSRRLGTKVNIANKTITVIYDGTSDLNRILDLMGMIEE